jgi:hypothetical protein
LPLKLSHEFITKTIIEQAWENRALRRNYYKAIREVIELLDSVNYVLQNRCMACMVNEWVKAVVMYLIQKNGNMKSRILTMRKNGIQSLNHVSLHSSSGVT